ncbi:MAG: YdjY domain-containing protein [Phycisphaerae bacterium]
MKPGLFNLSAAVLAPSALLTAHCNAPRPGPAASQPAAATRPAPRVVDYQPGIRIDYRVPQVEVAGKVILREGELELFAYSKAPVPKEHETVLLLTARPEFIYQALGLIGLKPGRPMSYDWETQVTTPPSGDPVDVLVSYVADGKHVEQPACEWMWDLGRRAPMRPTHWLFTGSRRSSDGRFTADVEGTVVTVVNFDTAVLSLPESHSESNAELWLSARTAVIPPVGTAVTLILRPAAHAIGAARASRP